jgi:F-type H+-transporting ATPase subunit delta
MIETKVSRRYARSLLTLATSTGVLEEVQADMKLFLSVCAQNRDLVLLFSNPIIQASKKLNILTSIFGERMNKATLAFFGIVTRKGREKFLVDIAKEFIAQYKNIKGIQTAEVISAVGLDENLRRQVYNLISKGKHEVELIETVDKKLIGGFILRIGDKQYDASVLTELRKLTQTLSGNSFRRN